MKKLSILALLIGQIFAFDNNIVATQKHILKLKQNHIPIIDIRLPTEWKNTGTIPNSYNITFFTRNGDINPTFFNKLNKYNITKNSKFAIICRTGHRTRIAAELIQKQGYKNVINLKGGMFYLFKNMLKECLNGKRK